ncbi:MAG: LptF/LptG family permease [Opitutales bacterium]|nr:LptF/LptG family permease [Opitutales bacterium]
MKILSRYILNEWWLAFLVAIFANTGLLVIEDIYKNAGSFIESGVPFGATIRYYFWLMVCVLPVVVPVSFFLSLLFSLGKLHKNNEILAMRLTGANIFQITKPLWVVSLLLCILSIGLNISISSYASRNAQDFYIKIQSRSIRRNIAFDNIKDHRTWFIGLFDRRNSSGSNLMLCSYDKDGVELSRVFAKSFEYKEGSWLLHDGAETIFDPDTDRPVRLEKFDIKRYKFAETPGLFSSLKKNMKHLSISELREILSFSGSKNSYADYRARYYSSIAAPLSCILILFITIPFATVGVRRSQMSGVAKACEALFLFYVMSSMFTSLGTNGVISLFVATFAPYAIVLMFSYVLYRKCV